MTRKNLIIVFLIICVIIIILILRSTKKDNSIAINDNNDDNENQKKSTVSYDEETNLYYIQNENTGEIIAVSYNEEDLEFYKEHPDYNSNPLTPKSNNLNEYIYNFYEQEVQEK